MNRDQHIRDWLVFAAPMPHLEAMDRINKMYGNPPKPTLSEASQSILSEFPSDAEEIEFAFDRGLDVLIDPKFGFVMSCAVTSITKEIASRYNYIVIEADSGLTVFY